MAVSNRIDGIVKKLLAKEPKDRFRTPSEVLEALKDHSDSRTADDRLAGIAQKMRRAHDSDEQAKLAARARAAEIEESRRLNKHMEHELVALIDEVYEEINRTLVETKITKRDSHNGVSYQFQKRELLVHFFSEGEMYLNPEVPGRMKYLQERHAVHGGFMEIREGQNYREGWNVVLVRPPEDIYGSWILIESRASALGSRRPKYEPFAAEARLFADNLACHWAGMMHTFVLTDKALDRDDVIKIFTTFIPG